jgi:3-hydroxybutyrate dehydrogenase
MDMSLKDKVALVTGAASGIGEQCARKLAADGATVVIADLNLANAQRVAEDIVRSDGKAIAVAMDVTSEEAVEAGIAETLSRLGGLDVLVSNAGIQIVNRIEDYAFADWKKMLAIHLDGAFLTTKAAIRHMYASGKGGAIIYMGSVHSHEASQLKSAYVTAKHGLLGLARVVAKEGGPRGVRANVVCPGFVRTPLVDKQIPEQAQALGISPQEVVKNVMLKDTVDGAFTSLADVANTVAFLAGFESNALTGQSIVVSHGWFMQ